VLFERFEDHGLAHHSYVVGCESAGIVAIVDPGRDVDVYQGFAHQRDLRITHVLETHVHADFASGAKELAERSGAELWLSAYDAGELYEVAFPHHRMHDGESLTLGRVRLEARHTPGHTPEHLSFLGFDLARAPTTPQILLSGDFLFVGSLGRPDLIGEDAKVGLANQLYDSVHRVLPPLPDGVEVHPAHGAGSMCGAGLSTRPMSTLGFERIANPYLRAGLSREAFVAEILGHVPPFPPYYKRMKQVNSARRRSAPTLPGATTAIGARDFTTWSTAVTSSSTCAISCPLARGTSPARSVSARTATCRPGPRGWCRTTRPSSWWRLTRRISIPPCARWFAWGWTMCADIWRAASNGGSRKALALRTRHRPRPRS
jgi:hydroxyacylglutathione hydrolase